jgi:glycosyltransferase involved in cell wall biosynthesis
LHILHITSHLPPDQSANALLPWRLGVCACEAGDTVEYVSHPPRTGASGHLPGPVTWVPRRTDSLMDRGSKLGAVKSSWQVYRSLRPPLKRADIVHVHGNGLLAELAVLLARRRRRPVVLTLYGTEIWHYRPRKPGPDLFTRAYHAASAVTFYSDRLLARARELGLTRRGMHTVYPSVATHFAWQDERAQDAARAALRISNRHLLLNVKRLHPLAGQRYLLEAMAEVIRTRPDTRLVICGTGALGNELRATARSAGVERHIKFAGLVDNSAIATYYAAADLFVLPSILEALPTVAVEALACGTPVLSSDNPGGQELNDLFGSDVAVVPRERPIALADAIGQFLESKRRTSATTREIIERQFRPLTIAAQYRDLYEQAAGGARV